MLPAGSRLVYITINCQTLVSSHQVEQRVCTMLHVRNIAMVLLRLFARPSMGLRSVDTSYTSQSCGKLETLRQELTISLWQNPYVRPSDSTVVTYKGMTERSKVNFCCLLQCTGTLIPRVSPLNC